MTAYKIAFPCPESVELVAQFEQGLITETELYRAQIDLAKRAGFKTDDELAALAAEIFVYSVAAGKYDDDGEDCKYCEDFATLRDAIVAWEECRSYPWSRVEHIVGEFVYSLDPMKIRRSKRVTLDNGEKRTLFMPCHSDGQFYG